YIGKGKKDKISKGDIAGFLMKVGGLEKDDIGRIDVRDHYAYAAVLRVRMSELLARIRGQKIKGQKTLFERTR
ncbi:MAG: DbpA RNA binding domain-containing protein, partial [Bacteroidaceae bacterium]|nr:DbpA RNA binding domain-containing protein [Bacteroidaceae bacterium]